MFYVGSTAVWTLPEATLKDIPNIETLCTDPLATAEAVDFAKALPRLDQYKTFGDVCLENDTVVFIPRKEGFVDKLVRSPWVYVGALTTALPALGAAVIADKLTQPKPSLSEKDRLTRTVFDGSPCPAISKKYSVDISQQFHISQPTILLSGRTRNAFQRWQNLSSGKGVCIHIFVGLLRIAERQAPGVITYVASDSTAPEEAASQFSDLGRVPRSRIKMISPLDLTA